MSGPARLGLDFGGVVAPAAGGTGRISALAASDVDPVQGAVDGIRELGATFSGSIWLVSKASPDTESWTRAWLHRHDLVGPDAIPAGNLVFVRDRSGKLDECRKRGITHFVDDRPDNLELLRGTVDGLYLFGAAGSQAAEFDGLIQVSDWPALLRQLRDIDAGAAASN